MFYGEILRPKISLCAISYNAEKCANNLLNKFAKVRKIQTRWDDYEKT